MMVPHSEAHKLKLRPSHRQFEWLGFGRPKVILLVRSGVGTAVVRLLLLQCLAAEALDSFEPNAQSWFNAKCKSQKSRPGARAESSPRTPLHVRAGGRWQTAGRF